ncbi:transposase domain-containing protein, partial [Pseudomonas syringae]
MDSGFFMSVAQDLGAVLDFAEQPLSRLDVFTDHIPQEWISTAATLAEKATVRRRRLPSDMVLWLVVGMALFRGEPIVEVARRLNICADGLGVFQGSCRVNRLTMLLFSQRFALDPGLTARCRSVPSCVSPS